MSPPFRKPPRGTRIMNPLYRKTPTVEPIEESSSSGETDDFSETEGKVSNKRLLVRFPNKKNRRNIGKVCPLDKTLNVVSPSGLSVCCLFSFLKKSA